MRLVDVPLRPLAEVTGEPGPEVALGHVDRAVGVKATHLVHQQEGHVFIVDVEDHIRPLLVNAFRQILAHQNIVLLLRCARVVLVDEVEEVPTEIDRLLVTLCLPVAVESFVQEQVYVNVDQTLEAFFLHPRAAVACELKIRTTNCL